jgi:hypothetical protein
MKPPPHRRDSLPIETFRVPLSLPYLPLLTLFTSTFLVGCPIDDYYCRLLTLRFSTVSPSVMSSSHLLLSPTTVMVSYLSRGRGLTIRMELSQADCLVELLFVLEQNRL